MVHNVDYDFSFLKGKNGYIWAAYARSALFHAFKGKKWTRSARTCVLNIYPEYPFTELWIMESFVG